MRHLAASAAALLLGLGAGCGPAPSEEGGDVAPDFTLPDLEGRDVSLSSFRGKTVIVDFWATWCPPCVFQVPELNKLHEAHREAGDLVVLGVSVDVDGREVVAPWVEEYAVAYPVLLGDEDLATRFGAVGFPTLAVVTPEGRLDSLHVGLIEYETLEELVSGLAGAHAGRPSSAGAVASNPGGDGAGPARRYRVPRPAEPRAPAGPG